MAPASRLPHEYFPALPEPDDNEKLVLTIYIFFKAQQIASYQAIMDQGKAEIQSVIRRIGNGKEAELEQCIREEPLNIGMLGKLVKIQRSVQPPKTV